MGSLNERSASAVSQTGLPQERIPRQESECASSGRWEAISGSADGSVRTREGKGAQARQSWLMDTVLLRAAGRGPAGTLWETAQNMHRNRPSRGAKSWAVYLLHPVHWLRGGAPRGVNSNVFPSHWPSGKALRWDTQVLAGGSCRCARMGSVEEIR